jgi:hypothetical protein
MLRTRHRRTLRLLATIVVLAVLLAPTASLASCCCVIARVGQAAGIATNGCCDQTQVASCCQSHSGASTPRSCCGQRETLGCGTLAVPASVLPTDCSCEHSCCDGLIIRPAAILTENESSRIIHSVSLDTAILFAPIDRIPAVQKIGVDLSFGFLSAPHRCAALCRWLN